MNPNRRTARSRLTRQAPSGTPVSPPARARPLLLKPVSLAVVLLGAAPAAWALPTGPVNTGGQVTVQQTAPGQMDILQGSTKASLDWTSFSIAAGERVNVVQPGRSSVLLNRVLGDDPSLIYGALRSNGSVWLVNPRGIVFGASSRVDVGGLMASTLAIADDALASGRVQLGAGAGGGGELRSEGQITAIDGTVALVAPQLLHSGQITARRVGLVAASEVLVDVEGDGLIFFNVRNDKLDTRLSVLGGVRADGGSAEFRATARAGFADTVLNLEGVAQARGLGVREGRIVIDGGAHGVTRVAGTVDASHEAGPGGNVLVLGEKILLDRTATLDASGHSGGGTVRVGGDFQGRNPALAHATQVVVQAGAQLSANATGRGDGGLVVVWSDEATRFAGQADARGGPLGGHGGLVEVSGKDFLDFRGHSDRSAPAGRAGQLLLDPTNLEIVATGADIDAEATAATDDLTSGTLLFGAPGTNSRITAGAVVTQLAGGPVQLQAVNDITVTQGITSAATNTLTLEAGNNITVAAASGGINTAGNVVLSASTVAITGATTTGAVTLLAPVTTGATRSITLNNGGGTGVHQIGADLAAGSLAVTGDLNLAAASTWTLALATTFNNTLTGSAALSKAGAGVLTLGGAGAYTGTLTLAAGGLNIAAALGSTTIAVNAGNLGVGAADLLADTAAVSVANGATLTLTASDTIATLDLAGTLAGGGANTLRSTGATTLTGATVDAGLRADTLASSGASVLRAPVVADTSVAVTGGTLTVGDGATTGSLAATSATVASGAALVYARSDDQNLSTAVSGAGTLRQSGGNLFLNGGAAQVATANVDITVGTVVLNAGENNRIADTTDVAISAGAALAVNSASETVRNLTLSPGNIGGPGALTVAGSFTSSGASRLLTSTIVTGASSVSGGVLKIGDGSLPLDGSLSANGGLTLAGGAVLDFDSSTASIGTIGGAGTLRISRGAATLAGTGLALAQVQVQGGSLTLADGVSDRINNAAAVSVDSGATFSLSGNRDETVGTLSLAGTLANSGRVLTAGTTTLLGGALVSGELGAGTLEVTGNSTLGAATAATTVNVRSGATLTRNASGDFAGGASLLVESGAALDLQGNDSVTRLTLAGTLSGGSSRTLTASTAFTLQDGASVDARLAGGAPLDADGTVALNQSAAATTVRVNSGTLTLGGNGLLASGATVTVASGATLAMGGTASINTLALAGTVSGVNALTTTTLDANVNGSTPLVNSAVTVSGGVNIASGVQLSVGNGGATGELAVGGTTTVNTGGTLVLNRDSALNATDLLGSNSIAGGGTLRHAGVSTLTLDKTVTSLGTVEVTAAGGSLILGNGSNNRIGNSAVVNVAAGSSFTLGNQNETVGTLNLSGTLAGADTLTATTFNLQAGALVSAAIDGSTLNAQGSGLSTLNADSAVNTLNVANGATLALGVASNLTGNPAVVVSNGGTLQLGRDDGIGALTLAGTLTGTFTLTASGSTLQTGGLVELGTTLSGGTLTVTGDATLNGRSTHTSVQISNGGTLHLGATPDRLNDAATVNISNGGVLDLLVDEVVDRRTGSGDVTGTGNLITSITEFTDGQTVNSNVNAGTLISNGNVRIASTVTISGTVDVQSGTLTVGASNGNSGSLSASGTITVQGGATLSYFRDNQASFTLNGIYAGAGTFVNNNTDTILVGGTLGTAFVNLAAGDITLNAGSITRLADTATVTVASGRTLTLNGAGIEAIGTLNLAGTLAGVGTLAANTFNLQAGGVVNAAIANAAVGATVNVTGASTLNRASSVDNLTVANGGALTLGALSSLGAATQLSISTGGTLTLAGPTTVAGFSSGGRLAGSGLLLTSSGGYALGTGAQIDANLAAGPVTVTGNSTLNGTSSAGTLTVNAGTLALGSGLRLLAAPVVSLASGSGLTLAGTENVTSFSSAGTLGGGTAQLNVSGAMALHAGAVVSAQLGGVTLDVDGNATLNRLTTATTVNVTGGAQLTLGASNLLPDTATVNVVGGLTLGAAETIGTLDLTGNLSGSGQTLTAGSSTLRGASTVAGNLGGGSLAVASGAAVTLQGTAASSSLNVNAGAALTMAAAGRLTGAPAAQIDGGLTLAGSGETLGTLSGAGTVTLGSATLTTGSGGSSVFNGTLGGSGGNLSKVGAGSTLTLIGNQTYTGTTTVSQGTLQLSGSEVLADTSSIVVAAGAQLGLGGLGSTETVNTLTLAGTLGGSGTLVAGTYNLAGGNTLAGTALGTGQVVSTGSSSLAGTAAGSVQVDSGRLTLASGGRLVNAGATVNVLSGAALTLTGNESAASLTLAGALDGAGRLNATTHTLQTNAAVNANLGGGTLNVTGNATLGGNAQVASVVISNTGLLTLGATADRIADSATLSLATGGQLVLGNNETLSTATLAGTLTGGFTFTADTTLGSGALVHAALGGPALRVTGNSTLNGTAAATTVQIDGGTLVLGSANRLAAGATVTVATLASLQLGGNQTLQQINLAGNLLGSGTLTATAATGYVLAGGTVNAALGSGNLSATGSSTLNAGAAVGRVDVAAGATLALGASSVFSATPLVDVAATGTLTLGSSQAFGALSGSGNLALGTHSLSTGSAGSSSFGGVLSGSGGLIKQGAGSFNLGGSQAYGGSTRVAQGTLALQGANVLPDGSALSIDSGATLTLAGNDSVASLALAGTLAGSGTLSAASTTLAAGAATGANADLGAATLTVAGNSTLAGRSAATTVAVNAGTLTLAAADRLADTAAVNIAAGAGIALNGNETVASLISAGSLSGSGRTLSATATTLQTGATVGANLGSGALVVSGNSTLAGTAASDTVTVNAGTLSLASAGRLAGTAVLTVANGATLTLGGAESVGSLTLAGTLGPAGPTLTAASYTLQAGAQVLANLGAGTLTSIGAATLAGTAGATVVNIDAGVLTLGAADRLADNAAVTVASGATLRLGGDDTVGSLALSGTLDGAFTLSAGSYLLNGGTYNAPLGGGEISSNGNSTLNATSAATVVTVNSGTLTLGSANRFTAAPALTVAGGAALNLGGDETVATLTGAGMVGLSSFTLTSTGAADATFSGSLGGGGGLVKQGSTVFTLSGNNAYTGSTRIEAGTLALGGTLASLDVRVAAGTLASTGDNRLADGAAVTVSSGALMTMAGIDTIASLNLAGRLSGTGGLTAASVLLDGGTAGVDNLGPGLLRSRGISTLNSASAAGTVLVEAGTLTLGTGSHFTAAPAVTVGSGATMALGGIEAFGSLAGAGTVALASHTLLTGSRGSSSFTGVLDGSGELVKQGATTFTLGGANTATGATRVLSGTLQIDGSLASSGLIVSSGAAAVLTAPERLSDTAFVNVLPNATLTLAGNETVASLALSGTLGGTGTLSAAVYSLDGGTVNTVLGVGTLTSIGASRLAARAGAATVNVDRGTLSLAAADLLADTATVNVASIATLALGGNDRVLGLALAGTLTGSGTLSADSYSLSSGRVAADANLGRGALASSGASELVGTVAVDTLALTAGTLTLASAGRLVGSPTVTVATGATLALGGNEAATSLVLAGTLGGGGTLSAATVTLSGGQVLADLGGGALTSTGSSALDGRAAATTLNVADGTLTLGGSGRLGAAPDTTVASGATLVLLGNETLGTLAGSGSVRMSTVTLTTGSRGDSRWDGVLSGSGALAKAGSSTFTLGGANTYTGATTVLGGTLATATAGVLPDAGGVTVDNLARLQLGGDETVATLLLAGTLDGSATLAATTYTLAGGTANAALGSGRLVSSGSSTLAGSAAATEVAVDSGTLTLASANRLADSATVTVAGGATLQINGDDTVLRADIAGTLAGSGRFSASTINLSSGRVDATLGGGTLSSMGGSTLNARSDATVVNIDGGTLTLGAAQRLGAAPALTLAAGAALVLGGDETLGALAGSGNLNLGAAMLRSGIGGNSSYGGVISGSGGLIKQGSGSFTLTGDQAYGGATQVDAGTLALQGTLATSAVSVNAGTLALAAPERLPDASPVAVASGASLTLAGNERVATLALAGTLAGSGTLTAAAYTLDGGSASTNLGTGTLQSSGNSRLDGMAAVTTLAVNDGTLTLGSDNRLSAQPLTTVAGGATLQLAGSQTVGTLAGAGTVGLAGHTLTSAGLADTSFSGSLTGSGGLVKQGGTAFTLSGGSSYTGSTRVEGGTLALTGTLASLDVQVIAGTLALAGNERLADNASVAVASGALMSMAGIETITSLNLSGTLTGTGGLIANSYTLRGGTASVDNLGSGALVSSGNSTLNSTSAAGTVRVDDGTLTLGAGSHFTATPAVTVAGGALLTLGGPETFGTLSGGGTLALASHTLNTGAGGSSRFDGVLSGSGELVKQGATTFTLGGVNTATGSTRILSGTLQADGSLDSTALIVGPGATLALTAPERLPDSALVTVQSGATLTLAGNETVASLLLAGMLGGSGTLSAASYSLDGGSTNTELGSGTLTAVGNSRLAAAAGAGSVTVSSGTLTLAAGNLLADTAAVTVAAGATLALDTTDRIATLALAGTLAGSGTLSATSYLLDGGSVNANLGAGALSSRGSSVIAGSAAVNTVNVQTGTLTLAAAQRLGTAPAVTLDSGATLALVGDQTLGTLAGSGSVDLAGFTLSTGSGGDSSFAGVMGGSGGLVKQGSSIFTLTGANTYTGATAVTAGTLRLGDGSATATSGSLATSTYTVDGLLELARADDFSLPQAVSGTGGVRQAGGGRVLFSGGNKTYTGNTTVASGELATAAAEELPDTSAVVVAATARLSLGGRETLRSLSADGAVSLAADVVASGDLLLRGAVASAGPLQLSAERIEGLNAGNRFGGALSVDARGAVALDAGTDGGTGGTARDLVLGTVRVASGGVITAGRLTLGSETLVNGGTLQLVATASPEAIAPDAELANKQAIALPIAWTGDAVRADVGQRVGVATGAALDIVASGGGSVRLLDPANNFTGNLSVVSGVADTPWSVNATSLSFGSGAAQNYSVQSRVQVNGLTVNVGGAGIVADVIDIRADRLATLGTTAALVARLPYDSAVGTATQLPALTLELTPAAYTLSFPFGAPGAEGGLRVDVGSRAYGNRTLPLDAGYVTVLPRDGARGTTAVLLRGPVVNPAGGYRFFFDGAGSQTQIPVFYNGVLPTTPQVENSLSAAVAVSEGARKERFDEAVRTENVAVRLRAGVIAEVGPAPSATQGVEGLRMPRPCTPLGNSLGCAKAP